MKKLSALALTLFFFNITLAQDKYVIFLKDKANSPYQINQPEEYLSNRSIERKLRMGIEIDSLDLPVNPSYLHDINGTGVTILGKSRWMNTVTVQADTNQIISIGTLPYVISYQKVYGSNLFRGINKTSSKFEDIISEVNKNNNAQTLGSYGGARNQTQMINADILHNAGYTGKNMIIAVLDAGFRGTDLHKAFDSLRTNNKVLGTWDFVRNDAFVYDFSTHGTSVLSCMGANAPDSMIGTAPHASYYLLRSEDEVSEYIIEEYNWVSAAEYADSVGADIINSSLGYTDFDARSQNHTYADMDGNTTVITKGANIASLKGILVVNSAGNSGNSSWYYIGAPADSKEVFTIGSVNPQTGSSGFSSHGPTADQRTKPDVVAQGGPAFVARVNNLSYGTASGTSFSGPVIAGFSACAWELYKQTHPNSKPAQVKSWIKTYSDKASSPDNEYGWGLPDGAKLLLNAAIDDTNKKDISIYPNPTTGKIHINTNKESNKTWKVNISDRIGKTVFTADLTSIQLLDGFDLPENISTGFYIISISSEDLLFKNTFIKQ